ncbi:hypothetical protein L210DRAFT_3613993 [Boletus edulis BED1]|uniref:DNA replication complex GINS protein SLD5 n=1 Tax=Boletus edulis BED1 TaxID=1328754 RepID=A0AAD4GAD5_BOLED|nr:hypothetical protein L210DRAFT_3613993 [Boletus edulis BED1]
MDDDDDFFTNLDSGNDHFQNRLRNAPHDDDDVPMPAALPLFEEGEGETPLQQLIRHWMNERHAPDVLPFAEDVLSGLLDHIRRQSETVQLLRSDPSSSEEEHFRTMLAQTEVERVKFVVRSYLRTRLFKIEKFARYIMTNPEVQQRLSENEVDHARRFAKLTDQHFYVSVLQGLPDNQQTLDDKTPFLPPMIAEPDKSHAVFVHARQRCPPVRLLDGSTLTMQKGHVSLTPYSVVEQLVMRGEVELV